MVFTKVCRSAQSLFLTHYFQKPFQHVLAAQSLENRNLPKVKYCSNGCLCCGHHAAQTGFCALLNVYFNDVLINRWVHLSSSLWGIPLRYNLFRKRLDQKKFLVSFLMVCNIFFCSECPRYSRKVVQKKNIEKINKSKAFCFSSKRNKQL